VSTLEGALHDPKGLDVGELLRLRAAHGDGVVGQYPGAERIPRDSLFTLPVDVLAPCGAQWSIHAKNADAVACRVLCPGANCVVHPEIRTAFEARSDVLAVPDFVANCGSVLDGNLPGSRATNERLLRQQYGTMVRKLVAASARRGIPVGALARRTAETTIRQAESDPRAARARERRFEWATWLADRPLAPARAGDLVARRLASAWTPTIAEDVRPSESAHPIEAAR